MALDKVLKIYDENGNQVDYDILASDVKFLPDGKDLPTKLTEMEDAIEDAAESGGYTPPQGGIPKTDLAPSVQTSLGLADTALQEADKIQLQAAINAVQTALNNLMNGQSVTDAIDTFNEIVDFLNGIDTDDPTLANQLLALNNSITALQTALAGKISGIKTSDNTPLTPDSNGIVTLPESQGGLTKEDISVETQGDGTVNINVKDDTYTINLNHTHENMAKLVVDTAANLPDASEMENDTIYGELDDGEIATIYLGGYPFYGVGGGASSGPVLRRPADGATIDMGQTTSGTVSKTINVKGKSLTQALTIQLNGTGYSFGTTQPSGVTRDSATQLTIPASSISAVNSLNGVDIVVVYTGSADNATCELGISSGTPDNVASEVTLIANVATYQDLAGVKFTGTQYVILDYYTKPGTKLEIDMQFEQNSNERNTSANNGWLGTDENNTVGNFYSNFRGDAEYYDEIFYWFEQGYVSSTWKQRYTNFYNRSTWVYNSNTVTFLGTNTATETKTTTQNGKLMFGAVYSSSSAAYKPFNRHNLKIYSIKISEGGTVLLNLTPKSRNGVVGLYDNKNGKFYTSETSNELIAIEQ